ncbi:MAG TPA: DUF2892 domain-containing protein [Vicinamibacterales bacterium]|nr:DUF2892 domain-containing protein [Vicinamibacterales bacterium]
MTPNQCAVERLARVAIGIGFVSIAVAVTPGASALVAFIGIITSMTGVVGWCPIYDQLGVSSEGAFANFLERRRQATLRE